jgi:hypothetical protein
MIQSRSRRSCRGRVKVRVTLQLAVYRQSIHLGDKSLETHDQYFFRLNIFGHSLYVTSSLMRRRVCHLQLLLVLASAVILRSDSSGTHDHVLLSQIRDYPQPGGPGPRIYIPQEQGCPVITPGTHGMRLFYVSVVLCVGSHLMTGWSPVQGVLRAVYGIKKLKNCQGPKGYKAIERQRRKFNSLKHEIWIWGGGHTKLRPCTSFHKRKLSRCWAVLTSLGVHEGTCWFKLVALMDREILFFC